jgi:phosphotransferase system  glucose/maltose/N-acetylglucosamine-specific IIC component
MTEITPQQPDLTGAIFPLIMLMGIGIVGYLLAKEKGRNVVLWTILGCIPGINIFAVWFFIGASNLKLEKKLDELIKNQKQDNYSK